MINTNVYRLKEFDQTIASVLSVQTNIHTTSFLQTKAQMLLAPQPQLIQKHLNSLFSYIDNYIWEQQHRDIQSEKRGEDVQYNTSGSDFIKILSFLLASFLPLRLLSVSRFLVCSPFLPFPLPLLFAFTQISHQMKARRNPKSNSKEGGVSLISSAAPILILFALVVQFKIVNKQIKAHNQNILILHYDIQTDCNKQNLHNYK